MLFRQALKHVSFAFNSDSPLPYSCLPEIDWILNKCHPCISATL